MCKLIANLKFGKIITNWIKFRQIFANDELLRIFDKKIHKFAKILQAKGKMISGKKLVTGLSR